MNNQDQSTLLVSRILIEPGISEVMYLMSEQLPEVFRHSINVAYLTAEICYSQLTTNVNTDLIYNKMDCIRGALLHDIGKLNIPKEVLRKKEKLTADELEIIRQHPKLGYDKLLDIENTKQLKFSDTIKDIILHHHEAVDGSGYPDKITDINMATKLVSLCDKYDAITEDRPYRVAKSKFNAYQILSKDNLADELFLLLVSCDNR